MFRVQENVTDVDYTYTASANTSIRNADAYEFNTNGSPNWNGMLDLELSPPAIQERAVDAKTSTDVSSITGIANASGHASFMNPWTQQYEQLSVDDTGSSPAQSEAPKKKSVSRKSERRKAQNRAAQRKFTARKLEYENKLVDRIAEMERTISRLGSENKELKMILESLKQLKRSRGYVQQASGGNMHATTGEMSMPNNWR